MGITAAWDPMADEFHRLLTEIGMSIFRAG